MEPDASAPSPGTPQAAPGQAAPPQAPGQGAAPDLIGPPPDWREAGGGSSDLWAPVVREQPPVWAAGSAPPGSQPPLPFPPGLTWPQSPPGLPPASSAGWPSTWQPPTLTPPSTPITEENEIFTFAITEGQGTASAADNAAAIANRLAGHGIYNVRQFAGLRPVDLESVLGEHTNAPDLGFGISAWARILHVAAQAFLPSNLHYSPSSPAAPRTPPPRGAHFPDDTPGALPGADIGAVLQSLARSHTELLRHQTSTLALQEKSLRASHRRDRRYLDPDLPPEDRGAVSSA